jgi:Na+/H+-dicarboxylate symporter
MLATLSKSINRPWITISAVILGVWLGVAQFSFLTHLQPIGEFYVALLQMCILPFLLATIPLAVRSAFTSGSGGGVIGRLIAWLIVTVLVVALIAVLVPTAMFNMMPLDQATSGRIGNLVGASATRVDIEFSLIADFSTGARAAMDSGLLAVIPTNVFSALSSNDSLRVVVFAIIFGLGMVMSEVVPVV